jgi:regulator of protease activity HflC (stomatin/prohibitin superfamily)
VNDAQGRRAEIVNISEAEMQRRINEAEGRANEIEAIAEATAVSIEQLADALSKPRGKDAMQLQLKEKYLRVLEGLGKEENRIILPKDLSNYNALMEGLALDELNSENKK